MKKILVNVLFVSTSFLQAQPGTLDTAFLNGGAGPGGVSDNIIYDIKVLDDNKMLVGGHFTSFNGTTKTMLVRLDSNGVLDNTFSIPSSFNTSASAHYLYAMAVQPDGKILVGGSSTTVNLIRLNADGSADNTFPHLLNGQIVRALALQSDGKILVGGSFYEGIHRYHPNGTLDSAFNTGGAGIANYSATVGIKSIVVQPDGKILVGGNFIKYNGDTQKKYFIRLNTDGSVDSTFNTGTGVGGFINGIALYPDGKIVIAGDFSQYNGASRYRVARINTNGDVDSTFNPAAFTSYPSQSGANMSVYTTVLQPDGKIIIGGTFDKYNNISRRGIARINTDGSIDNTFNVGTGLQGGNGECFSLALQQDEKVLVGGLFDSYNNTLRESFIRLNGGGTSSGIIELKENRFGIYPNPANSHIQIDYKGYADIAIIDYTGRTVYTATKANFSENINISSLSSGLYIITVQNETEKFVSRFVKQ